MSEFAEEQDLREIFERFGRVTRVFLAKDRETGRAKGFAFISYQERTDAAKACEKIDGCMSLPLSTASLRFSVDTDFLRRRLRASHSSGRVRKAGYMIGLGYLRWDALVLSCIWQGCVVNRHKMESFFLYESVSLRVCFSTDEFMRTLIVADGVLFVPIDRATERATRGFSILRTSE